MKKILLIILTTINIFGWEINTHRAIDRKALEASQNLKTFVANSGISKSTTEYNGEQFEDYGDTYLNYVTDGESNGISFKGWKQRFGTKPSYQRMIEAGSILEDAQWPRWLSTGWKYDYLDIADGRFLNHFEDGQTSRGLNEVGIQFRSASTWASGGRDIIGRENKYSYSKALVS